MGGGASAPKKESEVKEDAVEVGSVKEADPLQEECFDDKNTEELTSTEINNLAAAREMESEDRLNALDNYWIPITTTPTESIEEINWRPGHELRVTCCTWNMEAKGPPENLSNFAESETFHILAVGSQECMRSIQKSFIFSDKEDWEKAVTTHIGERYVLLESITLVATHLMVFARADVLCHITKSTIAKERVATGIGGAMGNKGGMGISFILGPVNSPHSVSLLFMCAHFAAHQGAIDVRNKV